MKSNDYTIEFVSENYKYCFNLLSPLYAQVFIEGFCHGNLLEEEAISLSNILKTKFSVHPLPIELRHKNHCIYLPPFANLSRDARVKNKSETNSVIVVIKIDYYYLFLISMYIIPSV